MSNDANEFPPLPLERLQSLTDPARNGPLVVSMAMELIELRKDKARLDHLDASGVWANWDDRQSVRGAIDAAMEATR